MTQTINHLPIFRMTHIDNVPFIVKNGLWSKLSPVRDPAFVPIGNPDIIDRRTNKTVVVIPPGGVLGECVPFYFSGHSPMLLNIATGYGVRKVAQKDIVFIVCDAMEIINAGLPFCFTDGNATKALTRFFNTADGLNELDWLAIRATMWKNTDDDYDRVRKKMSEFLVKDHVPVNMIHGIIVRDDAAANKVADMLGDNPMGIKVKIDMNNEYYYHQYD